MQNVACARPGEVPRAVPGAYPWEAGLHPVAGGSCAGAGVGSGAAGVTGLSGPCQGWAVCECAAAWTGSAGMQHPRRGPGGTCAVRLSGFFGGSPRLLPPPGSSCVAEGLQGRPPHPEPGMEDADPVSPLPDASRVGCVWRKRGVFPADVFRKQQRNPRNILWLCRAGRAEPPGFPGSPRALAGSSGAVRAALAVSRGPWPPCARGVAAARRAHVSPAAFGGLRCPFRGPEQRAQCTLLRVGAARAGGHA